MIDPERERILLGWGMLMVVEVYVVWIARIVVNGGAF